ncbi:MAG: hypothetical protein MN733_10610 [Nitrososphaera sp.]|nr:hypothetical protein [Nitrososphaera sp.]
MAERLFDANSREALAAPEEIRARAKAKNKQIKKIVWDKEGGYPEHAWGYVQWTIRPYEQRDGCDGTVDDNVHLIALRLCEALGLDYPMLYEKAYEWREEKFSQSWLRNYDWAPAERETIVPELSEQALRNLLYDLTEINNHSLVEVLEEEFTKLGYNVERWWED